MNKIKEYKCPICNKIVKNNYFKKHLTDNHNCSLLDYFYYREVINDTYWFKNIPLNIIKKYLEKLQSFENPDFKYLFKKQFNSFYKIVSHVRNFQLSDIDHFFEKVLKWKLDHPRIFNSKELCNVIFENDKKSADIAYHDLMLVKNPYFQHDGSISVFSKKFKGYDGLTDAEKEKQIRAMTKADSKSRTVSQIGYWLKKGFTEKEAKNKVKQYQTTFSLEKCIKKYGKEEGKKRFSERQNKWLKNFKKTNYSKISQVLFWSLNDYIINQKNLNYTIYFATKNPQTNSEVLNKNFEYRLKTDKSAYKLDFFVKEIGKIIEFDGEYWHNLKRNRQIDKIRDKEIRKIGYQVYHVKERLFRKNPEKVIEKCKKFLGVA